jgi:hypothetical protein
MVSMRKCAFAALALLAAAGAATAEPRAPVPDAAPSPVLRANIIDGTDDRDSLTAIADALGLSAAEVARIRKVSGFVGCFLPTPSLGSGALYLTNGQVLTVGHIFFEPSGTRRSKCFFRNQDPEPVTIDLLTGEGDAVFGAVPPRPGSNQDYAVLRLAVPLEGGVPFPPADRPAAAGETLIVITGHPAGMAKEVDKGVPVAQPCRIRRAPISSEATSFYRSDCDATGSSSGGMHLTRIDGALAFRGITITTGPWRDPAFRGAPYDERGGSVTTALGTDAAILEAGRRLAGR